MRHWRLHPPTREAKSDTGRTGMWGRFLYGEECLVGNISRVVPVGVLLADLPALAVNDQLAVLLLG